LETKVAYPRRLFAYSALFLAVLSFAFVVRRVHAQSTQRPSTGKLVQTDAPVPSHPTVTPGLTAPKGTILYTTLRGDTVPALAHHFLSQTSFLTYSEFTDALHQANPDLASNFLKPGRQLVIPGVLEAPISEKPLPVAKDFEVRAIYLTGLMAGSDHGLRIIRHWREVGGNAVVFDIKDSDGTINIPFDHPLAGQHKAYIHDLPKFVHFLHSQNLHAIARVAMFRDEHLVTTHPELAVKSAKTGQPWRENGKLVWTDPSQPKVQEYDVALAKKAIEGGADEIQFDYVRFPAEGDQKDASFVFQTAHPDWHRSDVIADFLKTAYAQIHPTGVLLSLDVFGIMAWQRPVDLSHTGQDIVQMAKHCDVLSPMIYPSHFFGMDGVDKPGDAPEHFIGESMDRFEKITAGSGVTIRPWLQAFAWRTKTYSPQYIEVQVATAKREGGVGFLFWNANNDYTKPYTAMPEMKATNKEAAAKTTDGKPAGGGYRYFRGDEVSTSGMAHVAAVSTQTGGGGQ